MTQKPLASARGFAVIPRATYRVQLNINFTFRHATALVPYLEKLGISHVYCSPYFRARPGSDHGYDVVDHNSLNPEIGTWDDFEAFIAALRAHGMGHILDYVPNHVGIMGSDNERWMHVLENGKASRYAAFFDIDWSPPNPALAGKLLVPALGDPYGAVLERGELQLRHEEERGSLAIFYYQHRFPLDPRTYPMVLEGAIGALDPAQPGRRELESLAAAFRNLPDRESSATEQLNERERDEEIHKERLTALLASYPPLREALDTSIKCLNGTPADAGSYDRLHELLELQCYRLAYWRVAADDINYRRFFDVNDLAALRMENEEVFNATHGLVLRLIREGKLDGLRIDHPDGLYEPARYFSRLQECARQAIEAEGTRSPSPSGLPIYLLAEKITASFERLPREWPVHGTTGYNFTNVVNGVFVDARAKTRLDRVYRSFISDYLEWSDTAYDSKVLVLRSALAAELNMLANQLARIAQSHRHTRDFTLSTLRQALIEVIAAFPVYRTYVTDTASGEDRRYIDWAIARTQSRSSTTNLPLLQFVRAMMLAEAPEADEAIRAQVRAFARKFQQVTSPVTAKGVEDTALYRFTRLASLNEVGGEPESFGRSIRQFHADARARARHWPHEMLTTSTHDTKRAEDVRARINVLSEMTGTWRRNLLRWSHMNHRRRTLVDEHWAPGPHAEYLLYQTLIGTWPLQPLDTEASATYQRRIEEYLVKAMREAKRRTSWANVNEHYETALRQFIARSLERRDGNPFPAELDAWVRHIAPFGFINSLSQTLCKLTAPGMPDIYQGNELWDWSLVDPDNRRPIDYSVRQQLLEEIEQWDSLEPAMLGSRLREAATSLADGRGKLYVTWRALNLRRAHETLFREGSYVPLRVIGEHSPHVLAFARRLHDQTTITVVPRLCARLVERQDVLPLGREVWADTRIELPRKIAQGEYRNVMDSTVGTLAGDENPQSVAVGDLLQHWPCALLTVQTPQSASSNRRRRSRP